MKNKIAIHCIVDNLKGYGNLSRCITLAEGLREKNYESIFIINYNYSAIKELRKRKFCYVTIPQFVTPVIESNNIVEILNLNKINVLLVDMREYGEEISKRLMCRGLKIILLDDAWGEKAYADIIFNGTMIKKYHRYKKINKDTKFFLGTKYWIINREFNKHKKKLSDINYKKKYNVIVSMGGSDHKELSLFIIRAILPLTNIHITVIVGPFFKKLLKLHRLIKHKKNITAIYSPKNIWKEFLKGDVVISNAGNTLFELAVQGIPTICIPVVKHQISYANEFASKGFAINLKELKNLESNTIRKTLSLILNDKIRRKRMKLVGNKIIDGKGLSRVTCILTKYFKQYLK